MITEAGRSMLTSSSGGWGLHIVVDRVRYKPGWSFSVRSHAWDTPFLAITFGTIDPVSQQPFTITHQFPLVVPQAVSEEEMIRFVFDCIVKVERHEAAEFFQVEDRRPFLPEHGAGVDPYKLPGIDETIDPRLATTLGVDCDDAATMRW